MTEDGDPFALLDGVKVGPNARGAIVGFRQSGHPSAGALSGRMAAVALPDGTVSEFYVHDLLALNPAYAKHSPAPPAGERAATKAELRDVARTAMAALQMTDSRRDDAGEAMVALNRSLTGSTNLADAGDAGTCLWHAVVTLRDWARARGVDAEAVVADAMAFDRGDAPGTGRGPASVAPGR